MVGTLVGIGVGGTGVGLGVAGRIVGDGEGSKGSKNIVNNFELMYKGNIF